MRRTGWVLGLVLFVGLVYVGTNADAFVLINEFLADPPGVGGDANRDGVISSANDEFIELMNTSDALVDLSGWRISDANKTRHVFPAHSYLDPESFFVVFGGGSPNLPAGIAAQKSSTGTLSLNNTGDTITLFDPNGAIMDQVIYGAEGDKNNSLNRLTDGTPTNFILHAQLPLSKNAKFSPGTTVDGQPHLPQPTSSAAVPEPSSVALVALGLCGFIARRRKGE